MAKKKAVRKKATRSRKPVVDEADGVKVGEENADFMEVGQEVVPGMRLLCICRGHQGTIGRIAWSPCGRFIASPSEDKTIRIWDANDGKCLAVLEGADVQNCAAWSPDGIMLAAGGRHESVHLWKLTNLSKGRSIRSESAGSLHNHNKQVVSIRWSADGDEIVTGADDGDADIRIWSAKTRSILRTLVGERGTPDLAWSPNGTKIASASRYKKVQIWDSQSGELLHTFSNHENNVPSLAWSRDGLHLVSGGVIDNAIRVWDPDARKQKHVIEGHTASVRSLAFSPGGELLASKSADNTVRLWTTHEWHAVVKVDERSKNWRGGVAFHPAEPVLATLGAEDTVVRIWDIDAARLIGGAHGNNAVRYTSAKIVLVGESNVGKSCLAMRLAEDRYPDDHEHGTTHGMRFWPMEAEELHPAAKPPEGQRRDVVLWDFGGQDEYQLVHQMFLHDTTLALVLIDPTRGRAAMDEARDWNKRLEKHLGGGFAREPKALASVDARENSHAAETAASAVGSQTEPPSPQPSPASGRGGKRKTPASSQSRAIKLLVGAKVDRKRDLIDQNSIDALCEECGFAAFLDLSAKTGRNTRRLRKLISDALDWDQMAKTSRPELFQHIRDDIEARRKNEEVALLLKDMEKSILDEGKPKGHSRSSLSLFELQKSIWAVTDQLATQGVVVKTKLMTGEEALVLQLPVIERYAGSLIIAARNNPRGVPVLEERLLGSTKTIPLPGMTKNERLSPAKERMVLECIVELMIQHGICFRHGGLLVFPTLFPVGPVPPADASGIRPVEPDLPFSVSLYYDFTGAIDNIYASLVSKLMVSEEFGEGRLKAGRVEFDQPGQGICGIRQIRRKGGLAHVDLFFSEKTKPDRKDLFTRFVEEHLRQQGVDIREHQAIKCKCGEEIPERIVQARIAASERDVVCPICETKTSISEGVARIRERDPESDQKVVALRQKIDKETAKDVARAKAVVSGGEFARQTGDAIRLLHLSDLHFEKNTSAKAALRWLLQDLRHDDANFPEIEKVEYLVVSGDVTHRGDDAGFAVAREFVEQLIEELKLSALRCVFVPGNHDIQRRDSCYRFQSSVSGLDHGQYVKKADDVYLVRDDDDYPNRLKQFSDEFYHKVTTSLDYPTSPEAQGLAYLFEDTGVQFLALNTAWEIDQFFPNRATVHPEALAKALATADKQVKDAIEHRDMKKNRPPLRIAVFHHAIHGPWAMQNLDFVSNLQMAGVRLCLHGDVHEMRRQWIDHWDEELNLHVVGAGTFGAKRDEITEGIARSYNLLEITPDLNQARVYVREQPKPDGAWRGWNHLPDPDGGRGRVPFFDIEFSKVGYASA